MKLKSRKTKKDQPITEVLSSSLIRRLLRENVYAYRFQLAFAIVFMILAAAMTAFIAALMQPVLDDVLYSKDADMIAPVAIALALTFGVRGICTYTHTVMMERVGHHVVADIQSRLFAHFMSLDMAFFHANPSGTLLSRVVNDVGVIRGMITTCMTGMGKSLFTLIFLVGVMLYQDWKLAVAAFFVFPVLSGFVIYIGKRLRKLSKSIQAELGTLSNLLSQTFQGMRLVRAYRMEGQEVKKTTAAIHTVRDLNVKSSFVSSLSTPFNEIIVGIIFAMIIAYGGYEVIAGRTSPGHLASFIAAFSLAYEPMKKLARLNNTLQIGLGACERVFSIMDMQAEISDRDDAAQMKCKTPDIIFKNVNFTYEGADLRALHDVSFTAKSGEVTALVGPSGGGKSTVMNLIPRFYDVNQGKVMIDGGDIRDVTQSSLRGHIALVSQDITIFNDTVFENIRYGSPDASADAVYDAAQQAAAHDFIEGLDDGYQTVVGEQGVKLSGGQKQRISIARAILRDAPILLLDEATSALDNESEKLVQDALKCLEKGRTTLVIAHRLTTVQQADQILVLNQGAIEERGKHQELIDKGGLYATMYETGMKD